MMMKELSEDHYIIRDDSEIKQGDWYYLPRTNSVYQCKEDPTELNLERRWGVAKITHSTQPLDKSLFFTDRVWGCERLSLGEVKELIGVVDVDNIVDELSEKPHYTHSSQQEWFKIGAYSGYNQALEDNKEKKYTEEDIQLAIDFGFLQNTKHGWIDLSEQKNFIQSLEPKTEWEVEFVDGKLILKK